MNLSQALGELSRKTPAGLPEVSEPEAIRHFVRLSQWNFSIDTQFYPLGSCTMKHNPKVNEWAARLDGFAQLHPLTPEHLAQGALELMVRLQELLAEIVGHGRREPAARRGRAGRADRPDDDPRATTSRAAARRARCSSRTARTAPIPRAAR